MARKRVSQTSLEYWKKREDEARRIYQEQEQNYDQEINRIYDRMLKDIQLQINGFFGRYASSEGISIAEAKARADAMDVASFAEKAKKYVQERDFSKEANEALKLYNLTMKVNRLEMLKANIGLEMCSGFDEMQKYFESILVDRVNEECERQSGILGQTVKNNAQMAKSIVGASFNNASFSDRIWMYQGMLRSELSSLLEQGIVQGKHANELARHLEKRFGASKFNAQRLMRTEMARVQTEAQKQSLNQTGYEEYIFIAEHDSRTCRVCGWLDGRTYKLSEMMPGTNAAPIHPMCRCSIAAYMERAEFEKMVARSQVPAEEKLKEEPSQEKPKRTRATKKTTEEPAKKQESTFQKAKNIKEAEEYAKRFVDDSMWHASGVSYNGLKVDIANEINEALTMVYDRFDIGKMSGITAPAGNTRVGRMIEGAQCAYNIMTQNILINRKLWRDLKSAQEAIDADVKAFKSITEHPERYDFNRLSRTLQNVIEKSKVSGRATVPVDVKEAVWHEIGHSIQKRVFSSDNWDAMKEEMAEYASKVSGYATTSNSEYVAESFCLYVRGGEVAPLLKKFFEGMEK